SSTCTPPRSTLFPYTTLFRSYVLTGSVRREAGTIHLYAQLFDTRTNASVWAEQYDRNVGDVFTLQSEIAQKIARKLGAGVSSAEDRKSTRLNSSHEWISYAVF